MAEHTIAAIARHHPALAQCGPAIFMRQYHAASIHWFSSPKLPGLANQHSTVKSRPSTHSSCSAVCGRHGQQKFLLTHSDYTGLRQKDVFMSTLEKGLSKRTTSRSSAFDHHAWVNGIKLGWSKHRRQEWTATPLSFAQESCIHVAKWCHEVVVGICILQHASNHVSPNAQHVANIGHLITHDC